MLKLICVISLFISVAYVSNMDYTIHVGDFERYCENVSNQVHPDYKNMIKHCE